MENKRLIELVNVTKDYDGDIALENINLYIRDGEFLTLLGPSGCGKTTLLRLIAGFIMPSSGQIIMDGKDLTAIPPYKRRVNTVFQKYALFPHLNVYDNIAFGLNIKKLPKAVIKEKVTEMLAMVNLSGFENRYIEQLSGDSFTPMFFFRKHGTDVRSEVFSVMKIIGNDAKSRHYFFILQTQIPAVFRFL